MTRSTAAVVELCAHCGLEVAQVLWRDGAEEQFCCDGCEAVYHLLHDRGLQHYYELQERRELRVRPAARTFAEFDHASFAELYVTSLDEDTSRVELYLEGVHCGSCVWLVERVPLLLPGVLRAELNVRTGRVTVDWRPRDISLSRIACQLDNLGYTPHPYRGVVREEMRRREDRALLTRVGVSGAIAINVMLLSLALYSGVVGDMEAEWERLFRWLSMLLVVPSFLWPGRIFFTSAIAALRSRILHMDVPIALGLTAGLVRGVLNTVTDTGPVYFDGLAILIFVLLVGRYLQMRGQRAASDSSELLYSLTPSTARVIEDEVVRELPSAAVLPGMLLEVRPGEPLPADGVVEWGNSQLNVSMLTGESRAVNATPGSEVFAGTVNLVSPLRVRILAAGEDSRVARLMRGVEEGLARRAPVVLAADKLASRFVAVVLLLAVGTFLIWLRVDPSRAWDNAIALLVVTCPCALALSTPLAVSVALGRAAKTGILIKNGAVLETLSRPSHLVLDKTGTITEARLAVASWTGPDWVKRYVVALEGQSTHPIAAAFLRAWGADTSRGVSNGEAVAVSGTRHIAGYGIVGTVDGHEVVVGSPSFVRGECRNGAPAISAAACGTLFTEDPAAAASIREGGKVPAADGDQSTAFGQTPVHVAVDGVVVGKAGLCDAIHSDARGSIALLHSRGWRVGILSGDAPEVVAAVAQEVGVAADDALGGVTPEGKKQFIEEQLLAGDVVMVGDGVNDAAAMARATVGVGVHGGAEACMETADVYLARPGLTQVVELVEGAARTMFVIRRNIGLSLVYNLVGTALAVSGVLSPLVAAVLMPASSLTVVLASWRSRTFGGTT